MVRVILWLGTAILEVSALLVGACTPTNSPAPAPAAPTPTPTLKPTPSHTLLASLFIRYDELKPSHFKPSVSYI